MPEITNERVLKSSVSDVLDLIGDRWTLLIFLSSFDGVDRFDQWKSRYGISSSILSNRLKNLVDQGFMRKTSVKNDSRSSRYELLPKGQGLIYWAVAVWDWERTWVFRSTRHPVTLTHGHCGTESAIRIRCKHCMRKISRENTVMIPGPGYERLPRLSESGAGRSKGSVSSSGIEVGVGQGIEIFGNRWSFLILTAAYFGVSRFDEFKAQLNIATNVLADRLKRFVEHGMLARNLCEESPARYEYILTEKSIDFFSVLGMLALWGDQWLQHKHGVAFKRIHDPCGKKLQACIYCENCCREVAWQDVDFTSREANR